MKRSVTWHMPSTLEIVIYVWICMVVVTFGFQATVTLSGFALFSPSLMKSLLHSSCSPDQNHLGLSYERWLCTGWNRKVVINVEILFGSGGLEPNLLPWQCPHMPNYAELIKYYLFTKSERFPVQTSWVIKPCCFSNKLVEWVTS